HSVHFVHIAGGKRLTHPGKTLRNKRQAPPARSRQGLAFLYRVGIAIEGVDPGSPFIEDCTRVAAGAEGAVDMGFARLDREAGDHFVEQNWDVGRGGGGAHAFSPFSSSR